MVSQQRKQSTSDNDNFKYSNHMEAAEIYRFTLSQPNNVRVKQCYFVENN